MTPAIKSVRDYQFGPVAVFVSLHAAALGAFLVLNWFGIARDLRPIGLPAPENEVEA
jgi:hypothetical protein